MIFSFMLYYFIGALIFFCHTAIITIKSAEILSSRIHLKEEEMNQLFIYYFARILFQTVIMMVFSISFWFYATINMCFNSMLFVSSGLFTVLWLFITGVLIKLAYYFATHKIKVLKEFDYDNYFQDKAFFWITCPISYGILFSLYDYKMFFTIFAIVLGKYIWMDSFQVISLSKIKSKIKIEVINFLKRSKTNILLLFCQLFVMGYLLVRWYPIKDELIHNYTVNTFLLLGLFLMPIIDYFIFESMKSYAGFIITLRKCEMQT